MRGATEGRVLGDHISIASKLSRAALHELEAFTAATRGPGTECAKEDLEQPSVAVLIEYELISETIDSAQARPGYLMKPTTDGIRVLCAAYATNLLVPRVANER